jgi:FemAB-related protein (PEP-CTERM system-associated)
MNSRVDEILLGPKATPSIIVRPVSPDEFDRWDEFVFGCSEATFFHRVGWKNLLQDCFGHRTHYLLAERASTIVGVLPLAEVKSLFFGHSLVSLPFCAYGGVAATESGAITALHRSALELGRRLGVEHLELRDRTQREPGWPQQSLYVTFRKEIFPEVEANLAAIPRKQRAVVRKGIKNGLTSNVDASVDRFFRLYADNVHRHGTPPLSRRYFETLQSTFGHDVEVLTITDPGGKAVSSVLSFYFRDEVLPYYAGDDAVARDLGANDFKYWELMRRASERGIRIFDYGRSKQGTGPFDFKRNWGFEPAPLAYEYCLYRGDRIPENNPLNPRYRALIALWRRLPIPVANFLGPHLVKSLG